MAATEKREKPRAERRGIANPAAPRDCLEAVDADIIELGSLRQRYMDSLQDAFTPLRSSAQLFREIFFCLDLPITRRTISSRRLAGRIGSFL
jgi:hypothetical protein